VRKARIAQLGLAAAVLALIYRLSLASGGVQQPIRYNHKKHVAMGLDCSGCHKYVMTASFAGLPTVDDCMTCHQAPVSESPEAKKIARFAKDPGGIPWRQVYSVPTHVFFSHRRHAQLAKIGCEVCHGDMKNRTEPVERPVRKMTMAWCMNCHKRHGASLDCVACHK
jgi:hypothetical protein